MFLGSFPFNWKGKMQTAQLLNELCSLLQSFEQHMNNLNKGKCWN